MERHYTITLKHNLCIYPPSFETYFKDYIATLDLFSPKDIVLLGSNIFTKTIDGTHIHFEWTSVGFASSEHLDELEAVKHSLVTAKRLEQALQAFTPLKFNPNLIYIFIGEDKEGNYMSVDDFLPNAKKLQTILYGGGSIAYAESSGHFGVYLGLKEEMKIHDTRKNFVESEGTAQPASSLDELLQRLAQKPQ